MKMLMMEKNGAGVDDDDDTECPGDDRDDVGDDRDDVGDDNDDTVTWFELGCN